MSEERNARKVYQGHVVSDKMDKTITVVIDTYKSDSLIHFIRHNVALVNLTCITFFTHARILLFVFLFV